MITNLNEVVVESASLAAHSLNKVMLFSSWVDCFKSILLLGGLATECMKNHLFFCSSPESHNNNSQAGKMIDEYMEF